MNKYVFQFVTGRAKSDVLLNNMCEVFNGKIVEGRDMPIISALEYIREYLMRRIVTVNKLIAKCDGPLTPTATRLLEIRKEKAVDYVVSWNGDAMYQVTGGSFEQYVVNMSERSCTCRYWEITGIPCKHAIAVNWDMARNNMNPGLIEEWVHPCYRLDTWKQVYSHKICPTNGPSMWPKCNLTTTIIPPNHHPQPGRPNKKRKRSATEMIDIVKNGKLSRKLKTVTCVLCKEKGHNKRTCKGPRNLVHTGGKKKNMNPANQAKSQKPPNPSAATKNAATQRAATSSEAAPKKKAATQAASKKGGAGRGKKKNAGPSVAK